MTRAAQDEAERAQVKAALKILRIKTSGSPRKAKPPAPDFTFKLINGRRIRMEVVSAVDQAFAAGSGARRRLARRIHQLLQGVAITAIVNPTISEASFAYLGARGRTAEIEREAEAIFEIVRREMTAGTANEWRRYLHLDESEPEPWEVREPPNRGEVNLEGRGVVHTDVVTLKAHPELVVGCNRTGGLRPVGIVQVAIDAKNEKIARYRSFAADEVWLLVVASADPGSAMGISQLDGQTFVSAFDRTLFLEAFEGKARRLQTTRR